MLLPDFHKLHDIAYFAIAEVDQARLVTCKEAVASLTREFKGSVTSATCSKHADEAAIWTEIGADADKVDGVVEVIIQAKQSTPLWSRLANEGCSLRDVGFTKWAISAFIFVSAVFHAFEAVVLKPWKMRLRLPVVALQALWGINMTRLNIDRRAFSVLVLEKVMAVYFILHCMKACMQACNVDVDGKLVSEDVQSAWKIISSGVVLLLSFVPPLIIIRLGFLGLGIVRCILWNMHVSLSSVFQGWRSGRLRGGRANH